MKHVIIDAAVGALLLTLTNVSGAIGNVSGGAGQQSHQQSPAMSGASAGGQPTTLGPAQTGQPNQNCGSASAPIRPGNAALAPGSAFNPNGQAGTVYAGQQPQNSRNTASVSQYDVACSHQR